MFWKKKTDTTKTQKHEDLTTVFTALPNDKWKQSLSLLFIACEPLTHDSIRSKQEQKELEDNISHHTFYCLYVKECIEQGKDPLDFNSWSTKNHFGNVLTSMFNIGRY